MGIEWVIVLLGKERRSLKQEPDPILIVAAGRFWALIKCG